MENCFWGFKKVAQLPMNLLKINVVFPFFNALGVFFVVMALIFLFDKNKATEWRIVIEGLYWEKSPNGIGKNHRTELEKITERNWEKSPNGTGKNHRTKLGKITERI